MAGGNLGDLWFNLSVKSNVKQDLNAIGELLQGLDLKSARTRKDLEGIFGAFNKAYAKEISEDFKNIAAQMNIQQAEAAKLSARLRELAKLKADIIERDRQSTEHGAFVAMQNESQQAQALAQRYTELAKLKENILARDKEMEAHGAFVALVNESQQAQALAQRERELLQLKAAIIRRNDEMVAAENRLAEATRRTNQARQEAVAHTRQQAEALVRLRVQELEAQRRQIQGLFGQGKNILSTEELAHLRSAFSQITQELNTLRTAMSNLGSYSARDLFSMGRGTSDFSPLISNMRAVVSEKQKAVQLEEKHRQEIAATAAKVRGDLVSAFEQARRSASGVNSTVQDLKNLFLQGGLVYGVQQFANSIIQTGGEMEKQHIALQSILGDMQNADIMFNNIKELALKSPFTFSELNRDVKQLAAYGVEYEQLYDTTKRLADISAGLGVSFERIALAFGQVRARGWLDGKELRQISYAGIPILNKLSEYYSKKEGQKVSTSDVKKRISNREVDFSDVKQIFWDMTDAGGQFYNMQEVLSETLLGRYNKLKDAWEIMLADFARGDSIIGGTFKTIIGLVTTLVQNINTIGPALMAVFGTVAIRKGLMAMGGNVGGAMLSAKASVATDIQKRLILGQQVSSTELRILATKRQITNEDFKALATARALTRNDLERLMLQGKITRQMYAQNIGGLAQMTRMGTMRRVVALRQEGGVFNKMQAGLLKLNLATSAYFTKLKIQMASSGTLWSSFAVKGLSAFTLLGSGVKALGATMWAAIGGLPGMIMTAVTMGVGYMISANAELRQALDQSQSELENRKKQIGEFLRDQDTNKAINSGDQKEIDNMIEEYKDKLKELAPSMSGFFIMNANEKKSHEERLRYLRDEMEAMKKANATAQIKLSNEDTFKSLKEYFTVSQKMLNTIFELKGKAQMYNATDNDKKEYANAAIHYEDYAREIGRKFASILPDVGRNPESQRAVVQMFDNMLAQANIPEEQADYMRASVMRALGIADGWLENQVSTEMKNLIDSSSSVIADKIRNNIELTDAEKSKVEELMADAKKNLTARYPQLAEQLQRLLDASNFQAIIKLVFSMQTPPGELENQVMNNILGHGKILLRDSSTYSGYAKKWVKGTEDPYEAVNRAHQDIDAALNSLERWKRMLKSGKAKKSSVDEAEKTYNDLVNANYEAFGDRYLGQKKKSNKMPKSKTNKEDTALKRLQERLSSLKSARQMYQKYQTIFTDEDARKKTYKLFPEVKDLDLGNYEEAVKKLMKDFNFNKSTERKKFQTSLYREIAEWVFSEKDKKEFDRKAADFKESMDRLSSQWDLYKDLLSKTGNKDYASAAFRDGYQLNDKAKELMQQYKNKYGIEFGLQDAMSMTDGEAKEKLKGAGQYDLWKKITDLLRNNYVTALQDGADAIQQTMSTAQKLDGITQKYAKKKAEANGDQDLIDRYDYLEKEEKSKVLLERIKKELDWEALFGNLSGYSKKELKSVRKQTSKLVAGGFLEGMSTTDLQTFYDGVTKLDEAIAGRGFGGMKDLIKEMLTASKEYDESVREYNEAVRKYGKDSWQAEKAQDKMSAAGKRKRETTQTVEGKKVSNISNIAAIGNILTTLGRSGGSGSAVLQNAGTWTSSIMGMFGADDSAMKKVGGIVGTIGGLVSVISEKGFKGFVGDTLLSVGNAVTSIFSDAFGLDLGLSKSKGTKEYEKAKEQYEKLVSVWDSLITKKTQYMDIHWGTEATKANEEARALLESEVEQARILANKRLKAGGSAGSHSYGYRMWKGGYDYNGQNWRDVAPEISSKYGVKFDSMEDLANMNSETLQKIKTDYSGLWANMDKEYQEYLEKLISYGDQMDDILESEIQKLTGNKFSDMVSAWGSAMATMGNDANTLVDNFESNLKNAILNAMVEEIFGDRIKAVLQKAKDYAKNDKTVTDGNGKVISQYTAEEYADMMGDVEDVSKDVTSMRDILAKMYGWTDNSNGSTTKNIKGITEETADLLASYINAIRLDVSVNRENITQIAEAVKNLPKLNTIAQSQLNQLTQLVSLAQTRNEMISSIYDWMRSVSAGTKKLHIA